MIYIPVGVFWMENMDCAGWSDLGIPDFPMIVDDADEWQFPAWFGGPFPRNIILDKDMEIIHSSINHNYGLIRADIIRALVDLPGNEQMEPSLSFGVNRQVDNQQLDPGSQQFPDITVTDGRIHTTWVSQTADGKDVFTSYSDNDGQSFSPPIQVNTLTGAVITENVSGPSIAVREGQVFLAWSQSDTQGENIQVYVSYSLDNGLTWSEPSIADALPGQQLHPDMEADGLGVLHLIYHQLDTNGDYLGIRYSVTEIGGFSFGSSTIPDLTSGFGQPSSCTPADLSVTESGDAYIAFRNNYNNFRDHFIAKKPLEQYEFSVAIPLSYNWWSSEECPPSGPAIDATANYIGAGYMVEDPANTYLRIGYPSSMLFSDDIQVHPEAAAGIQDFPSVAMEREYLHSVWVDDAEDAGDIFYGFTKSYDANLFNTQLVNDDDTGATQSQPVLIHHGGNLFCAWSDSRWGTERIAFASTVESDLISGDVNSDGITNILDIVLIVNFITGSQEPNPSQLLAADVNLDGILNILDIVTLINVILGEI